MTISLSTTRTAIRSCQNFFSTPSRTAMSAATRRSRPPAHAPGAASDRNSKHPRPRKDTSMGRHKSDRGEGQGRIDGQFVPMVCAMMDTSGHGRRHHRVRALHLHRAEATSAAWKERSLPVLQRRAARSRWFSPLIAQSFAELEHYGFIVKVRGGCLVSAGRAKRRSGD